MTDNQESMNEVNVQFCNSKSIELFGIDLTEAKTVGSDEKKAALVKELLD